MDWRFMCNTIDMVLNVLHNTNMGCLIKRAILYTLICIIVIFLILIIQDMTNTGFSQLLPNIITVIFQVIILGLFFDFIDRIKKYKIKISLYNSIKAILAEPLVRFNDPNNKSIDLNNNTLEDAISSIKKNIGNVGLDNYYELINILYSQRFAINGLLTIALQISEIHAWLANGLISTFTRLIDELEKIYKNNNLTHYTEIKNVILFEKGFNQVLKIYADNCMVFSNSKKKIV
jgi:hypothetical protein